MNVAYAFGYVPRFEGWEYLYAFIVGWSALIIFAGLLFDMMRYERVLYQHSHFNWSISLTIGIGFLSIQPFGLVSLYSLNMVLQSFAPNGACFIAAVLTVFAICSFIYNMFGSEFWKTVKQAR